MIRAWRLGIVAIVRPVEAGWHVSKIANMNCKDCKVCKDFMNITAESYCSRRSVSTLPRCLVSSKVIIQPLFIRDVDDMGASFGGAVVRASAFHLWLLSSILAEDFTHHTHVKRVSQRSAESRGLVFSGHSGFLPQGKLTGWVRTFRLDISHWKAPMLGSELKNYLIWKNDLWYHRDVKWNIQMLVGITFSVVFTRAFIFFITFSFSHRVHRVLRYQNGSFRLHRINCFLLHSHHHFFHCIHLWLFGNLLCAYRKLFIVSFPHFTQNEFNL